MILVVVEGKTERRIFDSLRAFYWGGRGDVFVYTHASDIYSLYYAMMDLDVFGVDGAVDTLSVLKTLAIVGEREKLSGLSAADISETYLFFDYDFQCKHGILEYNNDGLAKMLSYFNDETGNGKLYVNYPMIEALIYTRGLPDPKYGEYKVSREQCKGGGFKAAACEMSSCAFTHLLMPSNSNEAEAKRMVKIEAAKRNWEILKRMMSDKAAVICGEPNPTQARIFQCQLEKFVRTKACEVSVLSSVPLFLREYFGG